MHPGFIINVEFYHAHYSLFGVSRVYPEYGSC